jgi:DNA-binding NarL/FixJ family response regulator
MENEKRDGAIQDGHPAHGTPLTADLEPATHRAGEPVTVLVVDDHDGFREGLGEMLTAFGFEVVGWAGDGRTALTLVETLAPDVVVMDLQMPQLNGIEATRQIADTSPSTAVLVLTVSAQESDILDAMLAGACGYLVKGSTPEALCAGIEAAARGESMISAQVAAKLVGRLRADETTRSGSDSQLAFLSARELEILALLASGRANDDIAYHLKISPFTVRNHISNLLRKLQVDNRTQAAAFAIRHGL